VSGERDGTIASGATGERAVERSVARADARAVTSALGPPVARERSAAGFADPNVSRRHATLVVERDL
jgi:hypothetical protein